MIQNYLFGIRSWPDPLWLVLAVPILFFLAPKFLRYILSFILSKRKLTEKRNLQSDIAEFRKEMAKVSQVDEFAKYSKIQRKLRATTDKLSAISREDLELSLKYTLGIEVAIWSLILTIILRLVYVSIIALTGLPFFVNS